MEGGLSNIFLNNYIRPRCKNFIGVFSSDDLPSDPLTLPCCLIANLSKRNQEGSHFVAMYINKKNQLYYFDSFIFLPPIWNKCLIKFLRPWIEKNSFKVILSQPIQSFRSLFCGWYTCAFCLSVGSNLMTPQHFVKIFVKNHKSENDKIVTHFIKEIENKC